MPVLDLEMFRVIRNVSVYLLYWTEFVPVICHSVVFEKARFYYLPQEKQLLSLYNALFCWLTNRYIIFSKPGLHFSSRHFFN